ncbi:ODF3B protein, partial [Rostratula benghalensis]|nr:ODF3B protein [Rostratula benghalensis]
PPGPGSYTLPRLVGPKTTYTTASPCYSMVGKRERGSFTEDLAKTPGPAAFPKVELDIYKSRAPTYTMPSKAPMGRDRTVKPGPADYCVGRVRQPLAPSLAPPPPALTPLPLPTGLPTLPGHSSQGRATGQPPAPSPCPQPPRGSP